MLYPPRGEKTTPLTTTVRTSTFDQITDLQRRYAEVVGDTPAINLILQIAVVELYHAKKLPMEIVRQALRNAYRIQRTSQVSPRKTIGAQSRTALDDTIAAFGARMEAEEAAAKQHDAEAVDRLLSDSKTHG